MYTLTLPGKKIIIVRGVESFQHFPVDQVMKTIIQAVIQDNTGFIARACIQLDRVKDLACVL